MGSFIGGPFGGGGGSGADDDPRKRRAPAPAPEGRADLGIPDPQLVIGGEGGEAAARAQDAAAPAGNPGIDPEEVRQWVLEAIQEATTAYETGPNPRKLEYQRNWDAYWGRQPSSGKAPWQADERLSTVSDYVERFVAAMREALGAAGPNWYRFDDPLAKNSQLEGVVKSVMDSALAHCSQNVTGQHVGFPAVFANAVKAGCMSRVAVSVTWREGRLRIDNVDARELRHDPSGRGLYRIRERIIDRHQLLELKTLRDASGQPLYDEAAIDRVIGGLGSAEERVVEKERASGHGQQVDSTRRRPVVLHEFLGHILARDGSMLAKNQLVVMADHNIVIRGPQPNPFWHGMDWIVCSPIIEVPFSVEGRSYVESFAQLSQLFMDFTNLLLDAVRLESMPPYELWPEMLENPQQAKDGIWPLKVFLADPETPPGQSFLQKVETGQVPQQMFAVWEAISQLLRESASQNELRLGRLAQKSNVTATEIDAAGAGSNVLVKHLAEGIEQNLLSPILELGWYTLLQHMDEFADPELLGEIGPDAVQMIVAQREDIRRQSFRLRASGLSGVLALAQERQSLMNTLDLIGRSDLLAQQFLGDFSLARVLEQLLRSMRLDTTKLRKTPEEQAAMQGQGMPPGPAGGGPPDANPQLPVNLARASALRMPRTGEGGESMGAPGGGRSGAGPLRQ